MEIVDHAATVAHVGDGTKFPSASRLGGGARSDEDLRIHQKWIVHRTGERSVFPLHSVRALSAGERIVGFTAGGGGVGPAYGRDPTRVLDDVREELVSIESARRDYAVAIDPETRALDCAGTAKLRESVKPTSTARSEHSPADIPNGR
jgi:N-methylhydantoinase B/oxoprolinase/acetone carboxylase alpha subunit